MDDKSISLIETILLTSYLGAIMYVLGLLVFILLFYRKVKIQMLILLSIVQLLLSIFFSIVIWRFWTFEVMIGPVFVPSIFAEIVSVLVLYTGIQLYGKYR